MGQQIITVITVIALPFCAWFMISMITAFARVAKGGSDTASEFHRAGFTLRSFLFARVRRQENGALIPTRAGIKARVRNGKIEVAETRTISKDIF